MPVPVPGQILAGIVLMRFYMGFGWDRIAKELGVHPETSRQAFKRVEKRSENPSEIRSLLEAYEPKKS